MQANPKRRAVAIPLRFGLAARTLRVVDLTSRYGIVVALCVIFGAPFLWVVSSSFNPNAELFQTTIRWLPVHFTLTNYRTVFLEMPFWSDAWHTVYVTCFQVVGVTSASAVCAYGFSRIKWPGRNVVFIVLIATMILPYVVLMIPQYMIFKDLGWLNSFKPLTWPAFFGDAFSIFLLRQFMLGVPMELQDAAYIDGANHWQIFWNIILPSVKPSLATVALFTFMGNWNAFIGPLIYLDSPQKQTLALGMYTFLSNHDTNEGAIIALTIMMALPLIIIFFLMQKLFIQGISLTGTTK